MYEVLLYNLEGRPSDDPIRARSVKMEPGWLGTSEDGKVFELWVPTHRVFNVRYIPVARAVASYEPDIDGQLR